MSQSHPSPRAPAEDTDAPVVIPVERAPGHRIAVRWAAREATRRGVPLRIAVHADAAGERGSFAATLATVREATPRVEVAAQPLHDEGLSDVSVDAGLMVLPASAPEVTEVVSESYCPVAVIGDVEPPDRGPVVLGAAPWTAENAFDVAFREAAARDAPLHAIRLWTDPLVDLGRLGPDQIAEFDAADSQVRRELDVALSAWVATYPGVTVRTLVVEDDPVAGLLALTHRAQLLVLGRSVRGAALAQRVGSPVNPLVHRSRCPVLVVPADGPPRLRWLPPGRPG